MRLVRGEASTALVPCCEAMTPPVDEVQQHAVERLRHLALVVSSLENLS